MGIRVLAAVVLIAAVTGCGDIPESSLPRTQDAATPSARPFTGPRLTTATFATTVGKAMGAQKTMRMSMRVEAGKDITTVNATARLDNKRPAMTDMTMGITSERLDRGVTRLVVVDGALWAAIPTVTPTGKYVRIDPRGKDPISTQYSGVLDGMRQATKSYGTGLRKVVYVGREKLNGLELQHYRLTVDTAAELKALGLPAVKGLPPTVAENVWLDPSRLVRRSNLQLGALRLTMTAASYGQPADITPPNPSDVVKLSDLKQRKLPAMTSS